MKLYCEVGKEAGLVEELGALEVGEATPKLGFVLLGDRLKQGERYVMTDDRGRLEQTLLLGGQPVDARRQNRVDAGRNLDGVDGLGEAIRAGLADERLSSPPGFVTLSSRKNGFPSVLSINAPLSSSSEASAPRSIRRSSVALVGARGSTRRCV